MRIFETAFLKTETDKPEAGAGAVFRCLQERLRSSYETVAGAAE